MKLLFVSPGTGSYHCGVCMKDNALVNELRDQGHDAVMLPMYLPHVLDESPADKDQPIFFGGINAYLQLKYSFFRHVPKWLDKVLDSQSLLGKVSKAQKGSMTAGKEVSQMALSTFQGMDGPLAKEFKHLVEWIVDKEQPDAIFLSTAMQVGLASAIKSKADIPIFCSLQGEDTFLDSLIEPWKTQVWDLMRESSKHVEKFITPSKAFAELMAPPMGLPDEQLVHIPNGINLSGFPARNSLPETPAVGFLARLSHLKGMDILVDAFIQLQTQKRIPPETQLRIAGTTLPDDQKFIDKQIHELHLANLQDKFSFRQNLTRVEKIAHLRDLTVLSVPTRYPEAFGLYTIEALATCVPIVQPNHGAFPEIIEKTKGGTTFEPNTPDALADALEPWLNDPVKSRETGVNAHEIIQREYSIQRHAEHILNTCQPASTPA